MRSRLNSASEPNRLTTPMTSRFSGCSYHGSEDPPVGDCAGYVTCELVGIAELGGATEEDVDVDGAELDVVAGGGRVLDETTAAYTTLTTAPPQYWPEFNPVIWYDTGPGMC